MTDQPIISMVAAVARNSVIGHEGDMPWHVPSDLKRFKALTLGKPMIMGRKTFESIGSALPGRTSIVVTRQRDWQPAKSDDNIIVAGSLDEALVAAKAAPGGAEEICIVGGGNIYSQAMPLADVLHISWVQADPQGDTHFPAIADDQWSEVDREELPATERDSADLHLVTYRRKADCEQVSE